MERAVEQYITSHPGRNAEACEAAFKPHRPGITRQESTALYDAWAVSGMYEEDLNEERYKGPEFASRALGELFPGDKSHMLILDVACGTGMVSEKLLKLGFRRFHGIDPSPKMLNIAGQKGLYEQLFCGYLDANPLPMADAIYDGAVISGGIGANLIPVEGMRQLVRVVKPGGYIAIVAREKYAVEHTDYRDRLDQEMTSMETEGIWRLQSASSVPKYSFSNDGIVWKFVVC
ncbi:hypothetical protein ACOMHN_043382 [Nucella lapillus]